MRAIFWNRITALWLLLFAATTLSWSSIYAGEEYHPIAAMIIIIAFVKVRFIGLDFMELRHAPVPLRLAFEIWLVTICCAILGVDWYLR